MKLQLVGAILVIATLACFWVRQGGRELAEASGEGSQLAQSQEVDDGGALTSNSMFGDEDLSSRVTVEAADSPWSSEKMGMLFIRELGAAMREGNSDLVSRLAGQWVEGGDEAVQMLLTLAGGTRILDVDSSALTVLFKVSVQAMQIDPVLLAPWTVVDFVSASLQLVGIGSQVPGVLSVAFDEIGTSIPPSFLLQVVKLQTSDELGLSANEQLKMMFLSRKWAASMGAGADVELVDCIQDSTASEFVRGQATALLLDRDWRNAVPKLLELEASFREIGMLADGGNPDFMHSLASQVAKIGLADKGEYYRIVSQSEELAFMMAFQIGPEDARVMQAQLVGSDQTQASSDFLALLAHAGGAFDGGRRLLAAGSRASTIAGIERLVIGHWLHSELALDERFSEFLEPRFQARSSNPDQFWRSFTLNLHLLEEFQVSSGILPWLERSRGEHNRVRQSIVNYVNSRFENAQYE